MSSDRLAGLIESLARIHELSARLADNPHNAHDDATIARGLRNLGADVRASRISIQNARNVLSNAETTDANMVRDCLDALHVFATMANRVESYLHTRADVLRNHGEAQGYRRP